MIDLYFLRDIYYILYILIYNYVLYINIYFWIYAIDFQEYILYFNV